MKVLVGFLPTPQGHAAVERGIAEIELRGGELVLVHSLRGDEPADRFVEIRDALKRVEGRLDAAGVAYEVQDYARGNEPAEDILRAARDEAAELIVIGLRRRSPVGRLVLGSNAQRILLQAEVPVLAVRSGAGG